MSAKVEDAVHLHVQCSRGRTTPFEIDLSGVFFYFTVSHSSVSLTLQVLQEVLFDASRCPMTCDPLPSGCTPVCRTVSCLMAAYMQACWAVTCAIGVQQACITELGHALPRQALLRRTSTLAACGLSSGATLISMGLTSRPGRTRSCPLHRGRF